VESLPVVPDTRKTLDQLQAEWEPCRACELGQRREEEKGAFVFGEGSLGTIMFIGEGPGRTEEEEGRPFIGESGKFLRSVITDILEMEHYYLTNAVCCRSCGPSYDTEGNMQLDRRGNPTIKDQSPSPAHVAACMPRLVEEIYIVDPILIVSLGVPATEAMLGHSVTMASTSGKLQQAEIPGSAFLPALTPKGKWGRWVGKKEDRRFVWPVEQNKVQYNVLPVVHPAYAMRNMEDRRLGSPMEQFMDGMKKARNIYLRYVQEVYGDQ